MWAKKKNIFDFWTLWCVKNNFLKKIFVKNYSLGCETKNIKRFSTGFLLSIWFRIHFPIKFPPIQTTKFISVVVSQFPFLLNEFWNFVTKTNTKKIDSLDTSPRCLTQIFISSPIGSKIAYSAQTHSMNGGKMVSLHLKPWSTHFVLSHWLCKYCAETKFGRKVISFRWFCLPTSKRIIDFSIKEFFVTKFPFQQDYNLPWKRIVLWFEYSESQY